MMPGLLHKNKCSPCKSLERGYSAESILNQYWCFWESFRWSGSIYRGRKNRCIPNL